MADGASIQGTIRNMGRKDEDAGLDCHGGVSPSQIPRLFVRFEQSVSSLRMAVGLGMTPDEWQELRTEVDDSFWVMRAIGLECLCLLCIWIVTN